VLSFDCGFEVDFRPRHRSAQNLTVVYKEAMMQGDVVDRKRLEDLHPEQYTSILILSDADNLGTVDSDSRCIAGALAVLCCLKMSLTQLLACQVAGSPVATSRFC
jgi:hypothetical protein